MSEYEHLTDEEKGWAETLHKLLSSADFITAWRKDITNLANALNAERGKNKEFRKVLVETQGICEAEILEPHGNVEHKIVTMIRNFFKEENGCYD